MKHRGDRWYVRVKWLRFWTLRVALVGVSALASSASAAVAAQSIGAPASGKNLYQFDQGLRLGEARLFAPWWNALQRNALQKVEFDLCLVNVNTCQPRWRALRALVLQGRDLATQDKLELVNRYLNRQDYEVDRRRNNPDRVVLDVRSHWSTLFEFMARGGDCEDYAAAKYFLLRSLGLAAERLRVVVVWEPEQRSFHAILAYRWPNDEVWLLESDNRIKKRSHVGYRYVYALNEQAVWDYRTRPEWNNLGDSH